MGVDGLSCLLNAAEEDGVNFEDEEIVGELMFETSKELIVLRLSI
jgi:hypothetical protein